MAKVVSLVAKDLKWISISSSNKMPHGERAHHARSGFTLIETIVAVTVLAIIVSMLAVRITGTRDKQISLVSDQLADLLMVYAMRSEHSPNPTGISLDRERMAITLVRRIPAEFEGGEMTWGRDPAVPAVPLPHFIEDQGLEVLADGSWTDIGEWPLLAMPGQDRPEIEINLTWDERTVSLRLSPHSMNAVIRDSAVPDSEIAPREKQDLDATGLWQSDW